MKKVTLLLLIVLMLNLSVFVAGTAHAVAGIPCPDNFVADQTKPNSCTQWDKDGDGYLGCDLKNNQALDCNTTVITKKGTGDCLDVGSVTDNAGNIIKAKDIHPDAIDVPNNGVDEDCNGEDAVIGAKTTMDAQGVLDNIRNFLIWVVGGVSGIILIIGGIMYAMAAGDEQKTKKARKAIIGAVVGLVVALLANVIIMVVSNSIVK